MVKVFAYSIPNIHVKIHSEYLTQTKYDDWYSFLLINYGLQWEKMRMFLTQKSNTIIF